MEPGVPQYGGVARRKTKKSLQQLTQKKLAHLLKQKLAAKQRAVKKHTSVAQKLSKLQPQTPTNLNSLTKEALIKLVRQLSKYRIAFFKQRAKNMTGVSNNMQHVNLIQGIRKRAQEHKETAKANAKARQKRMAQQINAKRSQNIRQSYLNRPQQNL